MKSLRSTINKILKDIKCLKCAIQELVEGGGSGGGGIQSIQEGTNITVDNTDPENPVVSVTGINTPTLQQVTTAGRTATGYIQAARYEFPDGNTYVGYTTQGGLTGTYIGYRNGAATGGGDNIAIGRSAITLMTSNNNIVIGDNGLRLPGPSNGGVLSNSIVLGSRVNLASTNRENAIAIGNDLVIDTPNQVQLGNDTHTTTLLNGGVVTMPNHTIALIDADTTGRVPITKEWFNANNSSASGLEAINEGNGVGWRLIGRDPANFGNIGNSAVDLSYNNASSSTHGAVGNYSFATGYKNIGSGAATFVTGQSNQVLGSYSFVCGANNIANLEGSIMSGSGNVSSGIHNNVFGYYLLAKSDYETVIGSANTDYTPLGDDTDRLFCIGNGVGPSNRSNAFIVLKNGLITAPSVTTALIDAEATGKVLITREWFNANLPGGGSGITSVTNTDNNLTVDTTDPDNPDINLADNITINQGLIVNNSAGDFDTQIKGDTENNLVYIDASADSVGIGIDAPTSRLHVAGTSINAFSSFTSKNLNTNTSASNVFSILSGNTSGVVITASNAVDTPVYFKHNSIGKLIFGSNLNNNTGLIINSSGLVSIGTAPTSTCLAIGSLFGGFPSIIADGGVIINEGGYDLDTRIEGSTDQNLVFVDAGTDRVGIGNNAPTVKFDVTGDGKFSGTVVVANATVAGEAVNKSQLDAATINKPIKIIPGTTYTLLESDKNEILHFTSATDVTITVPVGLTTGNRYEGKQRGTGQLIFVNDGTTVINVGASETNKTLEQFSVFGLDSVASNEYDLYGKLELV